MGRQVMLSLGASSARIKALDFKWDYWKSWTRTESAAPPPPLPALAQGHWAIQPENFLLFSADRTPLPSIQGSAIVGCNSRLPRRKRSAPTGCPSEPRAQRDSSARVSQDTHHNTDSCLTGCLMLIIFGGECEVLKKKKKDSVERTASNQAINK